MHEVGRLKIGAHVVMRAALAAAVFGLFLLGGCRPLEIVYDSYQYHPPGFSATQPGRPNSEPAGEVQVDGQQIGDAPDPAATYQPPIRFTPADDRE